MVLSCPLLFVCVPFSSFLSFAPILYLFDTGLHDKYKLSSAPN
uniref:Uncharacterized protein n=1 Tax=Rhizophora mucronata TaxID=61149 RepID=A0A2P2QKB0_RHIMU